MQAARCAFRWLRCVNQLLEQLLLRIRIDQLARGDVQAGVAIGVIAPAAFGRRQPKSLETWHCVATRDVVEFVRRDYFARASWSFAREQFLVAGALPAPAV